MARALRAALVGLVLGLAFVGLPGWAQAVLPVPELRARVMDFTGTLDAPTLQRLNDRLQAFEQTQGTQIVVLMVATTAPEDIADTTQRLGDAWQIGRPDVGDGVLFVIAKDDRRMRIAPAKALEGALPDVLARRIIDQAVAPAFRRGDYAAGIEAGLAQIETVVRGEALPEPVAERSSPRSGDWTDALVFLLFAIPMIAGFMRNAFGNRLGALLTGTGAGLLGWILTSVVWVAAGAAVLGLLVALFSRFIPAGAGRSGGRGGYGAGWSGGGRRSGGGGGFRSGGGGNFGGGGASGGW